MRYKRYTGNRAQFEQAIKNFKPIPGVPRAYINRSATEFIILDTINIFVPDDPKATLNKIMFGGECGTASIYCAWTVHYINPHSGKNDGMKMIRIHRKQYGLSYIMARTYIDNPHHLKRVYHKDGNHNNYHADNLEWR